MNSCIYTDLAFEARELHPELAGVLEENETLEDIQISRITIQTEQAASKLHKQRGRYVTLDAPLLAARPLPLFARLSKALCAELTALMPPLPPQATVLAIGLGNRAVTPDALGPRTMEQLYVTRHIKAQLPNALPRGLRGVCAIAPGVLGVTGIETMEIVRGVVEHVQPQLILAVDALASRRAQRISTTIQLSDAGIAPGSGVGNPRMGLCVATFGIPVIAIGVPMVVYASTIVREALELIAVQAGMEQGAAALEALAEKAISEEYGPMIVTPKDIDAILADMSRILADGLNMGLFGAAYEEVRALM